MKMREGFSLVQVMIAITLSSFIMIGMMQGYRNALKVLNGSRYLLTINRRIALLFNQVERDITTSFVFDWVKKPVQKKDEKLPKKEVEADAKEGEKKQSNPVILRAEYHDDAMYKARGKKWQMLKKISFVCTNPLEVYGSKAVRMVRVGYELVFDKENSAQERPVYILYRKETSDLENNEFSTREKKESLKGAEKTPVIHKHVVATNIKNCAIEFTYEKKEEKKEDKDQKSQEVEVLRTFVWTEKEENKTSKNPLPDYATFRIELWNDDFSRSYPFECIIPFYVKTPIKKRKKMKEEESKKKVSTKENKAEKSAGKK